MLRLELDEDVLETGSPFKVLHELPRLRVARKGRNSSFGMQPWWKRDKVPDPRGDDGKDRLGSSWFAPVCPEQAFLVVLSSRL